MSSNRMGRYVPTVSAHRYFAFRVRGGVCSYTQYSDFAASAQLTKSRTWPMRSPVSFFHSRASPGLS